jgi:hypothetical protein
VSHGHIALGHYLNVRRSHVYTVNRHEMRPVYVPLLQVFDRRSPKGLMAYVIPTNLFSEVERQNTGAGADIY